MKSICEFRSQVDDCLGQEAVSGKRRNVIILAVDGIGYARANAAWPGASVECVSSVFPSTSSAAWMSALTGASVDEHGIPGVAFRVEHETVGNIFNYQGSLNEPGLGTLFSDAESHGYAAKAVLGDWENYSSSWRNMLLKGGEPLSGYRFYTDSRPQSPTQMINRIEQAINDALDGADSSVLVWCFIDVDQHVHVQGYDKHVDGLLVKINELALNWTQKGNLVIAHSDHGLIETTDESGFAPQVSEVIARYGVEMGGAGRVRWFYTDGNVDVTRALSDDLTAIFGVHARIANRDEYFAAGSLAYDRVGEVVVVAQGCDFLCDRAYTHEHGSWTDEERLAMVAQWQPEISAPGGI